MSSLVSLKKDIESFEDELISSISEQEEALLVLQLAEKKVNVLTDQVKRLKKALAIVEGTEVMREPATEAPAPLPGPTVVATPAPIPKPPTSMYPPCGACGGKMFATYKTVPSGITVSLLMCDDCNNENYT